MASDTFKPATFAYFKGAAAHPNDRAWFEAHRNEYEELVAAPFARVIVALEETLGDELTDVAFNARKLTRPLRRQPGGADLPGKGNGPAFLVGPPLLRPNATAFFSTPATSRFEMNPGIYLSLGAQGDDNVCGVGIYMPSSRQMKLLRMAVVEDPATLDGCLEEPAVRRRWGGLSGDRFQRFPKGHDENGPGAAYLWHKQFFLSRGFSREQAARRDFAASVAKDFALALPFLKWVRETVGVYRRVGRD